MTLLSPGQRIAVKQACDSIAPSWPLDRSIAVSPYWKMRHLPAKETMTRLQVLAGIQQLSSPADYQQAIKQGQITDAALAQACEESRLPVSPESVLRAMTDEQAPRILSLASVFDQVTDVHKMAWHDEIVYQISQCCADFVQTTQDTDQPEAFYRYWREQILHDRGIDIIMDEPSLRRVFADLPACPEALMVAALNQLGVPDQHLEDYALSSLMDINGWASYFSYLNWQSELDAAPRNQLFSLLAVRIAWDWILKTHYRQTNPAMMKTVLQRWQQQWQKLDASLLDAQSTRQSRWILQRAAELTYQQTLQQKLLGANAQITSDNADIVAVFCIDVRSELMRRHFEAQSDSIKTQGFAGFFGLPLAYQPAGMTLKRPHLPGLLAPIAKVSEACPANTAAQRISPLYAKARFRQWGQTGANSFGMVESMGWLYGLRLLVKSFMQPRAQRLESQLQASQWSLSNDAGQLSSKQRTDLAFAMLNGMQLTTLPRVLLLVGHASETMNNPHAASLDCGACGGQSGELSARVASYLLNDSDVQAALRQRGIAIPANFEALPALHNTTTQQLTVLAEDVEPALLVAAEQASLAAAAETTAQPADATALEDDAASKMLIQRARDWSQVRPEWGLANNAAFIVAPRQLTRHLQLDGRAFLHDYQHQQDNDYALLTQILSAPMLVTHWINMQYNASVWDNHKLGAGNKVLHNVVADNVGVFEGNGGDLRIGLSKQSLHDGQKWMHQPLRLSVYVCCPAEVLLTLVEQIPDVRQLVDNEWLYLFAWDGKADFQRIFLGRCHDLPAKSLCA